MCIRDSHTPSAGPDLHVVDEQRKFRGEEPLTAAEFLRLMREKRDVYKRQAMRRASRPRGRARR